MLQISMRKVSLLSVIHEKSATCICHPWIRRRVVEPCTPPLPIHFEERYSWRLFGEGATLSPWQVRSRSAESLSLPLGQRSLCSRLHVFARILSLRAELSSDFRSRQHYISLCRSICIWSASYAVSGEWDPMSCSCVVHASPRSLLSSIVGPSWLRKRFPAPVLLRPLS